MHENLRKRDPLSSNFYSYRKKSIYNVYIKNQRVGAATKSSIWIIIECSDFQKINFWIFVCWGVTFFFYFGIQSLNNASKDYEKNRKLDKKIISICEIFRIFCMHALIVDEFYFIQEWKFY